MIVSFSVESWKVCSAIAMKNDFPVFILLYRFLQEDEVKLNKSAVAVLPYSRPWAQLSTTMDTQWSKRQNFDTFEVVFSFFLLPFENPRVLALKGFWRKPIWYFWIFFRFYLAYNVEHVSKLKTLAIVLNCYGAKRCSMEINLMVNPLYRQL